MTQGHQWVDMHLLHCQLLDVPTMARSYDNSCADTVDHIKAEEAGPQESAEDCHVTWPRSAHDERASLPTQHHLYSLSCCQITGPSYS